LKHCKIESRRLALLKKTILRQKKGESCLSIPWRMDFKLHAACNKPRWHAE
jgi:hypothetical protein